MERTETEMEYQRYITEDAFSLPNADKIDRDASATV